MVDSRIINNLSGDNPKRKIKIELFPRVWNSLTNEYDFKAEPYILTNKDISKFGNLQNNLDYDVAFKWEISNLSLTLRNDKNQWKENFEFGYFSEDYLISRSKMIIHFGIEDNSGNEVWETVYTGYISDDYIYNPEDLTIQIKLYSDFENWQYINAEEISIEVVDEEATEVDTSTFITNENGVGFIDKVLKGETLATAIELEVSTDYDVENLNVYEEPATITLETPIGTLEKIWITYRYWHTELTIEEIVGLLCDKAGITLAKRDIDPVVFANVGRSFDLDFINNSSYSNFYRDVDDNLTSSFNINVDSGSLRTVYNWNDFEADGLIGSIPIYNVPSYGTFGYGFSDGADNDTLIAFVDDLTNRNGYYVRKDSSDVKYFGKLINGVQTDLKTISAVFVRRDIDNIFYFYTWNGSNYVVSDSLFDDSFTDNFNYILLNNTSMLTARARFIPAMTLDLLPDTLSGDYSNVLNNYFYTTPSSIISSPTFWSGTLSQPVGFEKWGQLLGKITRQTTSADYSIYYRGSSDNINWSSWQSLDFGDDINSNELYIQIVIKCITNYANGIVVNDLEFFNYIESAEIPLINFTGLDLVSALEELANICGYEFGLKTDEIFFFKNRVGLTGNPKLILDNNDIIKIENYENGISNVYNSILVEFGKYIKNITSKTLGDTQPDSIDKYGERVKELSSENFIPADNIDLATAIAPTIYQQVYQPKAKVRLTSRYYPQLELGDKIQVNFLQDYLASPEWNEFNKYYNLQIYSRFYKIVGIRYNPDKYNMTLDLLDYTIDQNIPSFIFSYIGLEDGNAVLLEDGGKIENEEI